MNRLLILGLALILSVDSKAVDFGSIALSAQSKPVPTQTKIGYPLRAACWSGCGSWQHMTKGEHAGKYSSQWLKSLTWQELQSLHSDDHEGRVKWEYVIRPSMVLTKTYPLTKR